VSKKDIDKKYFIDRQDAARKLLDVIPMESFESRDTIIIAVSSGAIVLADILASKLKCEMDILLVDSVLAPNNQDLSIAKVSETQDVVIHKALTNSFDIDDEYVYQDAKRVYDKNIIKNANIYRKGRNKKSVKDKAVLLVDECIETELTVLVSIKSMIASSAKNVYVATPILDEMSYINLTKLSDGVYCPHRIRDYISVEYYYENLQTLKFEEIERIMDKYE